jgi:toxin-antitoxin system PIN domain toxin
MIIPDLNVLLYAVNEDSSHHRAALAWLQSTVNLTTEPIGLPWTVQIGFLRLTTSRKVFSSPLGVAQAFEWLERLKSAFCVQDINPGKAHFGILRHLLLSTGTGANLTTDAHLAALAIEQDATLVTGDRDFLRFPGLKTVILF